MKIERCFRNNGHPLILREKNSSDRAIISCRICTRIVSEASFYACDQCRYYLHSSCADLPQQITHFSHPNDDQHTLALVEKEDYYKCDDCVKHFENCPLYKCNVLYCKFCMDVECALMPAKSSPCGEAEARCIQHLSHPHPLFLIKKDGVTCRACGLTCTSGFIYGCAELNCHFFLHKSCAEFSRELKHPHFGLQHGNLSLRFGGSEYARCTMCEWSNSTFRWYSYFFRCNSGGSCTFKLCWSCGANARRRVIVYECDHCYKMQFVDKLNDELNQCHGFEAYCTQPLTASSNEVSHNKSSILRCVNNGYFTLHILCGPLPSTVKHECHIHSLILVDWIVEDDYDEYYCDVCEEERDPRIRFYYCKDCKYFAHVHCLFTEIAKVLSTEEDQLNNVELKIMGQDLWNLPDLQARDNEIRKLNMSLRDVIYMTEQEQHHLKRFYDWNNWSKYNNEDINNSSYLLTSQSRHIMSTENIDESLKLIRFTNNDFETFFDHQLDKFYLKDGFLIKYSELNLNLVDVQGYMVPYTVHRVMRALLHKYGDISCDSENYSRKWKSFTYFVVCEALRKMSTKLVTDITKDDLREWYHHLKFAKTRAGFKVDFACVLLERQVRAFLALQAEKLKDKVPAIVRQKIAIIEEKMEKLQQELDDEKSKLEICNAYSGPALKSQFMSDCLKEASDMEMKKACCARDLSFDLQRIPTYKAWEKE